MNLYTISLPLPNSNMLIHYYAFVLYKTASAAPSIGDSAGFSKQIYDKYYEIKAQGRITMQQICVHLRSSAVNISDKLRLPRLSIGAPDSINYLAKSSYEFVLSSLFKFHLALRSLRTLRLINPKVKQPLPDVTSPAPFPSALIRGAPRQTARRGFMTAPDL